MKIVKEHPKIIMFDINTVQNMITELTELIPINSVLNNQLTLTNPVRSWIKIDRIDNLVELGGISIKHQEYLVWNLKHTKNERNISKS